MDIVVCCVIVYVAGFLNDVLLLEKMGKLYGKKSNTRLTRSVTMFALWPLSGLVSLTRAVMSMFVHLREVLRERGKGDR